MVKKENIEKKWYQSKTFITNIVVIIIGVLSWIQGQVDAGAAITALGILNAVLRTITKKKIQFK
jgi:hypothetical protein